MDALIMTGFIKILLDDLEILKQVAEILREHQVEFYNIGDDLIITKDGSTIGTIKYRETVMKGKKK